MLDEADLDEKYKNKPDQLANIKQHAYSCIHPTRRVKMWEDVELRRHWNQTEIQKTDVGREATGSVTAKQAKPLKDKTEKADKQAKPLADKKAKPLADKKAKPLGPTLKNRLLSTSQTWTWQSQNRSITSEKPSRKGSMYLS